MMMQSRSRVSRGRRQFVQVFYYLQIFPIVHGGENRFCGIDVLFMDTVLDMSVVGKCLRCKILWYISSR